MPAASSNVDPLQVDVPARHGSTEVIDAAHRQRIREDLMRAHARVTRNGSRARV
jgi:hypothetical protein